MATKKKVVKAASYGGIKIGEAMLIRTVTFYHLGILRAVKRDHLILDGGGWVADTKRFGETLETGGLNEFERVPRHFSVGRGAIVDCFPWDKEIPSKSI